jgi:Na+/proline symporter
VSNAKTKANPSLIRTLRAKAGLALLLACMVVAGAAYFPPGPNAPVVASSAWPPGPSAPAVASVAFPPGPYAPDAAVSDTPLGLGVVGPDI